VACWGCGFGLGWLVVGPWGGMAVVGGEAVRIVGVGEEEAWFEARERGRGLALPRSSGFGRGR